jgi:hypothetical protein
MASDLAERPGATTAVRDPLRAWTRVPPAAPSPLFEGDAPLMALPVSEFSREPPAPGGDRLSFLALLRGKRLDGSVVHRRCVLLNPLSPQVAGPVVVDHPEFPVAVRIMSKPALADKELQHRPQRPDRLQDLLSIGQRVGRPKGVMAGISRRCRSQSAVYALFQEVA